MTGNPLEAREAARKSFAKALEQPTDENKKEFLSDYDRARALHIKAGTIGAPNIIRQIVAEMTSKGNGA